MGNLANRVWETATTTGTGTFSLLGAQTGYQGVVAGHGNGSTVDYCIEHTTAAEWEYGEGVITDGAPDTLTRVTVWSSSNGGSLVNFSAGTKNVFCSPPAQKLPLLHLANTFTANQYFSAIVGIGTPNPSVRLGQKLDIAEAENYSGANLSTWATAADTSSILDFSRSRSATIGTHTVVQSGDSLGYIAFRGSDGSAFQNATYIKAESDGTPGPSDMPGRLLFFTTPDGSATALERLRITNGGNVGVGMTPTVQFELSGSVGQKASGTTWSNPSDVRLKEDVRDFTDGLNVLRKVRPVHYALNGLAGTPKGTKGISIIAQEMLEVMPYTIETYKTKLHPEDEAKVELYRFEASALTFALVNAVKELAIRLEKVEAWTK